MQRTAFLSILPLIVLLIASADTQAAENGNALAATSELPAALRALGGSEAEILTQDDAQAVRGQWILTLNFPLLATQIQGHGKAELRIVTLSNGIRPGTPVSVWLKIGRY
jgi:hypothetical protein